MTMLSPEQKLVLAHLRTSYMGPAAGETEETSERPDLTYVCGALFPQGSDPVPSQSAVDPGTGEAAEPSSEELAERAIAIPEEWSPASVAITFLTRASRVFCDVSFGTYSLIEDQTRQWKRHPHSFSGVDISQSSTEADISADTPLAKLRSRWRKRGDAWLVTLSLENAQSTLGTPAEDVPAMLFQVGLEVTADAGFLPHTQGDRRPRDREELELSFRFRNRLSYASGHGMASTWHIDSTGKCDRVSLDPVPWSVVPKVKTTGVSSPDAQTALKLATLCAIETDSHGVTSALDAFCDEFSAWVDGLDSKKQSLDPHWEDPAQSILSEAQRSRDRVREGIQLLRTDEPTRRAFRLAMRAIQMQMQRSRPGEPSWRPFQLGFILASLASTANEQHLDRELVDLIWFPTGGGKTEAYLGLAAFEIFRRRLSSGGSGGGTAVITRYTLRLLTAQQFQRSASLICAMEVMRQDEPSLSQTAPFTIGLWVGDGTTPNTWEKAVKAVKDMHTASDPREKNVFQMEKCPWCQASLVPKSRGEASEYGFRVVGGHVEISCTDSTCDFASGLPVAMVDAGLYAEPPTFLLSTVDKLARMQVVPEASALFGIDTPFDQPGLIIQDELHLLAGPLGTTVATFEAAILTLLELKGSRPKIVASTATIRAAAEQVESMYGRKVSLYPPSGFEEDQSFFSQQVIDEPGRLYIGLMPQSVSQATAVVASATPLLEIPEVTSELGSSHDQYWTLVVYHNSLRELGRSESLIRDDTNARLKTRAHRRDHIPRQVGNDDLLVELTSRKKSHELTQALQQLEVAQTPEQPAVDVVLSSNMLSVGIDVQRLALMLMVGQPKTTAEYIQATSRVGRGSTPGIVVTLFRANRARDRSFFEGFRGLHESLYRHVEPTSVTPWALSSRHRSLAGCIVMLLRNGINQLSGNEDAVSFNRADPSIKRRTTALLEAFLKKVQHADPREATYTALAIERLLTDWERRSALATAEGSTLHYEAPTGKKSGAPHALLKRFGISGDRWPIGDSMRSVEPAVGAEYQEER